jgi:hypothetical protein
MCALLFTRWILLTHEQRVAKRCLLFGLHVSTVCTWQHTIAEAGESAGRWRCESL